MVMTYDDLHVAHRGGVVEEKCDGATRARCRKGGIHRRERKKTSNAARAKMEAAFDDSALSTTAEGMAIFRRVGARLLMLMPMGEIFIVPAVFVISTVVIRAY
jgi:hypothetical protein